MNTKVLDFRDSLVAAVAKRFKVDIERHVVKQLHRDGDVTRVWRCGIPDSGIDCFYVCVAPDCLMVYGDRGECMWRRCYDMIPFIRGSINSLDYFSEKVPHNIRIKKYEFELVSEWLEEFEERRDECEYDDDLEESHDSAVQELRESIAEDDPHEVVMQKIWESGLCDGCDYPSLEYYTWNYLWKIEGLKWFIAKLDAGEVVQPQPLETGEAK